MRQIKSGQQDLRRCMLHNLGLKNTDQSFVDISTPMEDVKQMLYIDFAVNISDQLLPEGPKFVEDQISRSSYTAS